MYNPKSNELMDQSQKSEEAELIKLQEELRWLEGTTVLLNARLKRARGVATTKLNIEKQRKLNEQLEKEIEQVHTGYSLAPD